MSDQAAQAPTGFRGYIASRPVAGVPYPHKVQNLVIRDYCQRKGLLYYLSATEISVPGSFMMLNDVLGQLNGIKGIVLFSQFMLPENRAARRAIYEHILGMKRELHAALEEAALTSASDIDHFDEVLAIAPHLKATPFGGRFSMDSLRQPPNRDFESGSGKDS